MNRVLLTFVLLFNCIASQANENYIPAADASAPAYAGKQEETPAPYRNLAAPIPAGSAETWFLREDGMNGAMAERRNWHTGKVDQFSFKLPTRTGRDYRRHYAMAANRHGLWLAENTLALLRPDGSLVRLNQYFPEPPDRGMNTAEGGDRPLLISLQDDSVLLLYKLAGETKGRAFRLIWRNPTFVVQELKDVPGFGRGMAAVRLTDSRVLVTGGYGEQDRAWLFDPRNERWTETGKLGVDRLYPALAALPDGRAFIAGCDSSGTASDDNQVRIKAALGAELFDPASNQWRSLPNMPLSFRVDAYGAEGPSATVMPDGSLIMGGAMHRHLLRLDAQGNNFAPYWRVSDPLDSQRVGGIVQAIGNDEIVVASGRMLWASGQCCKTRGDSQRLSFPRPGEARRVSLGLPLKGAAVAHRGHRSFIGGGEESFSMSFTSTQASAVAELVDHRSGEVRELASLPRPIAAGKAIWLDDDRIFVKAITRPAYGQDGRSYEFPTAGYLAVYSLKRNQWQPLFEPSIAQAELAGRSGKNVLMVSNDAQAWSFNADTFTLEELPRPVHMRRGGVQRVLTDGRLILAGGATQSELLEAYDIDCRSSDCPLQRFAYGPPVNTQHYEIYSPATKRWTTSALSRGAGESAVIRRDGRVMSLGRISDQSNGQWLIEQSDTQGKRWQRLPMPTELDPSICAGNSDSSDKNCSLLIGDLPEANLEAVLFASRHWDNNQRDYLVDLWLFNEVGKWQSVARNLSSDALATRKFLLRRVDDKVLQATHFQSDQFMLSLE